MPHNSHKAYKNLGQNKNKSKAQIKTFKIYKK